MPHRKRRGQETREVLPVSECGGHGERESTHIPYGGGIRDERSSYFQGCLLQRSDSGMNNAITPSKSIPGHGTLGG